MSTQNEMDEMFAGKEITTEEIHQAQEQMRQAGSPFAILASLAGVKYCSECYGILQDEDGLTYCSRCGKTQDLP